jgi:hypothetical protein
MHVLEMLLEGAVLVFFLFFSFHLLVRFGHSEIIPGRFNLLITPSRCLLHNRDHIAMVVSVCLAADSAGVSGGSTCIWA